MGQRKFFRKGAKKKNRKSFAVHCIPTKRLYLHIVRIHNHLYGLYQYNIFKPPNASQEQTLGGKKRPSIVNPFGMLFHMQGTIKAKNKKNWVGNIAFIA